MFIKKIHKFLRYNEGRRESINQKSVQLNLKIVFTETTENQWVVFVKQSVVYSSSYKLQAKNRFKHKRDTKNHTVNLYWFTLSQELHLVPRKPLSIPLCNQKTLITTHTPKWWSWTLQEHTPPLTITTHNSEHPLNLHTKNYYVNTIVKRKGMITPDTIIDWK